MIYLTLISLISRRGSVCTTWIKGLYELMESLIARHPNVVGGRIVAPLPTALHGKHFQVADLLLRYGATVDVRGFYGNSTVPCVDVWRH